MIKVAVVCFIELAGIRVDTSVLGRSITAKRDTWAYRIDLPKEPESFKFMCLGAVGPPDERDYPAVSNYIGSPEHGFVEIRIVRIVVNATYDVPGGPIDRGSPDNDQWAQDVFFNVRARALDAARDLTDLVRMRGQATIEPTGRYPRVLMLVNCSNWMEQTRDHTAGR
jgi:hypothetical protein